MTNKVSYILLLIWSSYLDYTKYLTFNNIIILSHNKYIYIICGTVVAWLSFMYGALSLGSAIHSLHFEHFNINVMDEWIHKLIKYNNKI